MGGSVRAGRAEVWRRRIEGQQQSGLSIAEFCRREGISPPAFYAWRKRLSPAQRQSRPGTSTGPLVEGPRVEGPRVEGPRVQSRSAAGRPPQDAPLFVPVTLVPPDCGVRLELPGGAVLTLPGDASPELVTAAIGAALSAVASPRPAAHEERAAC